jgi:hypothetical protein
MEIFHTLKTTILRKTIIKKQIIKIIHNLMMFLIQNCNKIKLQLIFFRY